jgi:hypothetical protein
VRKIAGAADVAALKRDAVSRGGGPAVTAVPAAGRRSGPLAILYRRIISRVTQKVYRFRIAKLGNDMGKQLTCPDMRVATSLDASVCPVGIRGIAWPSVAEGRTYSRIAIDRLSLQSKATTRPSPKISRLSRAAVVMSGSVQCMDHGRMILPQAA